MGNQENIIIFYGPKKPFQKYIENNSQTSCDDFTLTQLVNLSEKERNKFTIEGIKAEKTEEQVSINNLIINAEEYSGVTEAVVNNFVSYISKYEIKKIFIQNPPQEIIEQLYRQYDKSRIKEFQYEYEIINEEKIKKFKDIVSDKIIGQDEEIAGICRSLIIQSKLNNNKRPIVVMLYGPSGVGKTETARCITEALGESMFYKQFSMFQNNGFREYLYGISYRESCFAKDLLNRDSNVIFLDEFDKANIFVYSGLYQMFDEGIFRDNNYEVNLENSLIICTSNYSNLQDIMNQLGSPMFYRINCFVEYKKLSLDTILKLIDKSFENNLENLDKDIVDKVEQIKLREFIKSKSKLFNNARQIDNIIKEKIAEVILNMKVE